LSRGLLKTNAILSPDEVNMLARLAAGRLKSAVPAAG
jgi:hypothetical protein